MKRFWLSLGSLLLGTTMAASSAHAVANHSIEQVQKIVKNGKVVGARVHLLVSPEYYTHFNINLAPEKDLPAELKKVDGDHRKLLAGAVRSTYLLKQLKKVRDLKDKNGTHEIYVDIIYGKRIKAGQKVNLLSAYSSAPITKENSAPHIFGAWDGPVQQHDAAQLIELPGEGSNVPTATKTLAQQ
jgi:hypothetical protein